MTVPVGLSVFTARRGSQAMVVLMDQRRNAVRGHAQTHPTLRFKRLGAHVGFRRRVAAFGKGATLLSFLNSRVGAVRLLSAAGVVGRSWRRSPFRSLRVARAQQANGGGYSTSS